MKNGKIGILALLFVVINLGQLIAQDNKTLNLGKGKVALQGYDPVSYIVDKKAVEGDETHSVSYKKARYLFHSQEYMLLFKKSPEKYMPAYGGWCAYAMGATGEKVKIDPKTFKIIEGKTYLFYNFGFTNTLKKWDKDEGSLKRKGDINWAKIVE